MKNRRELAKHFKELDFRVGAEIGVCQGYYSKILYDSIPGLTLYGIDVWYKDSQYQEAVKNLGHLQGVTLIKKPSMEAVKDFQDKSLDFVYIDANHRFKHVTEDIEAWTPKVRKGGIVAGHDYYLTKAGNIGVVAAVNNYVNKHGYELNVTAWDLGDYFRPEHDAGGLVLTRNMPYKFEDEVQPSWWFVK